MSIEEENRMTIVCLHGSASNYAMWRSLRDAVRGRARVITPDVFAPEDVFDSIQKVNGPIHLVGHGYGGAIAARFAAENPERVASLVLYEPAVDPELPCGRNDVPLRIISGTRSWSVARQAAEYLANCFHNSSLLQLFGMRHMAPLTHPERVNGVILDYLLPVDMPGEAGPAWEQAA